MPYPHATFINRDISDTNLVKADWLNWVNNQAKSFISVLDPAFGATGDGVTIDRAACQAAIDYVFAAGGGTVLFPPGTYLMDASAYSGMASGAASLILKTGVTLLVEGTIKTKPNAYGGGAFYGLIRTLDAGISNAAIIGNGFLDGDKANQVASVQCSNVLLECIENVRFGGGISSINANGEGVMMRGSVATAAKNLKAINFTIKNCSRIGFQSSQFDGLVISDFYIDTTVDNGIDIYGEDGSSTCHGTNFSISNGVIKSSSSVGVFLETVANGTVHGVTTLTCDVGVQVNRINGLPRNIDISGNTFRGGDYSFLASGDYGSGSGVHFHGNTCEGYALAMVNWSNTVNVTCESNIAYPPATTTPLYVATSIKALFCQAKRDRVMLSAWDPAFAFIITGGVTTTESFVNDFTLLSVGSAFTRTGVSGNVASGGTFTIPNLPFGGGVLTIYGSAGGGNHSVFVCAVVCDTTNSDIVNDVSKTISGSVWVASVAGGATTTLTVTTAATGSTGSGVWRLDWISP